MINFFQGVQCVYLVKFVPVVSHNGNPIIKNDM